MSAKQANLAEVFKQNEPHGETVPTEKKRTPAREKKKHIGGYFDEAVYRQMKHLGVEKGMTTQAILAEALNAFFERNNKPPIA